MPCSAWTWPCSNRISQFKTVSFKKYWEMAAVVNIKCLHLKHYYCKQTVHKEDGGWWTSNNWWLLVMRKFHHFPCIAHHACILHFPYVRNPCQHFSWRRLYTQPKLHTLCMIAYIKMMRIDYYYFDLSLIIALVSSQKDAHYVSSKKMSCKQKTCQLLHTIVILISTNPKHIWLVSWENRPVQGSEYGCSWATSIL